MSIKLRLAYAEYESGDPLFAWLNGSRLPHEDRGSAHRLISEFRKGVVVHGDLGTAVRLRDRSGENLLIQTAVGFTHASGAPQRVVVVFSGVDWNNSAWTADMATELASVLAGGDILTEREPFAAVIEWATAELSRGGVRKQIDIIRNFSAERAPFRLKTALSGWKSSQAKNSRRAGRSSDGDGTREARG
jgi:hypothetical protein